MKIIKFSEEEVNQIIKDYKNGVSVKRLSEQFNISFYPIKQILLKNDIEIRTSFKRPSIPQHLIPNVIEEYKMGFSANKLGEKYNIDSGSIRDIVRKNGGSIRNQSEASTKYSANHNYFNTIDTANKAYFLGFLYADGCILNHNKSCNLCISISLTVTDGYILEKFKKELEFTGEVRLKPCSQHNYKSTWIKRDQKILSVTSGKLCDDLIKLGCVPCKSLILKFPTNDQVPKNLMRHFIRGLFDGDGCITGTKTQNGKPTSHTFSIVGTLDVCNGVQAYIDNLLELNLIIIFIKKQKQVVMECVITE